MRIAIIGAGIVGVTTAFELAADGHQVTVFERHAGVASETSFANAGVLAPGYVTPWAGPGMPWKVLSQLFSTHTPVRLRAFGALAHLPWMWRWWRACRASVYQGNRASMFRLARYSTERRHHLSQEQRLEYELRSGYLVLLRGARELAQAQTGLQLLRDLGVNHQLIDAEAAYALEPGLSHDTSLHGAISLPQDEVGNCRQFAHLLKTQAQRLGAHFRFQHDVQRIEPASEPLLHWMTQEGDGQVSGSAAFDRIVLCSGHVANQLLSPLGQSLSMAPVYGYSVTAPLRGDDRFPDLGPRAALMDEKYKVAVSRLGQRVRVAGSAELGGSSADINQAALRTLYKVLNDWFPSAALLNNAQHWKGARPMLPDGPPVIGASRTPGVWLNLGHGSSGWALACGSARVVADLIADRAPDIDITGLDPERCLS